MKRLVCSANIALTTIKGFALARFRFGATSCVSTHTSLFINSAKQWTFAALHIGKVYSIKSSSILYINTTPSSQTKQQLHEVVMVYTWLVILLACVWWMQASIITGEKIKSARRNTAYSTACANDESVQGTSRINMINCAANHIYILLLTNAPLCSNKSQMALPIPEAPPVTKATEPVMIMFLAVKTQDRRPGFTKEKTRA